MCRQKSICQWDYMPSHKMGPIHQAVVGAPFRATAKPDVVEDRTSPPAPLPRMPPGEKAQ